MKFLRVVFSLVVIVGLLAGCKEPPEPTPTPVLTDAPGPVAATPVLPTATPMPGGPYPVLPTPTPGPATPYPALPTPTSPYPTG